MKIGGQDGLPAGWLLHRQFHQDGGMRFRVTPDLGPGIYLKPETVSKAFHCNKKKSSKEQFVEALRNVANEVTLRTFGDAPALDAAARPAFTHEEQRKRKINSTQTKASRNSKRHKDRLDKQVKERSRISSQGGFPCDQMDVHRTSYCTKVFKTQSGLNKHAAAAPSMCEFTMSTWSTQDELQHRYCQVQHGANVVVSDAEGADAAPLEAANVSYFSSTISDDAKQNVAHLLAHRIAAKRQRQRIPALQSVTEYINKSDGARTYNTPVSWLTLSMLHELNQDFGRCTESRQSVPGDGKTGVDSNHAEQNRALASQLALGGKQTTADEIAEAQAAARMKGSVVCSVKVPRNDASKTFASFEWKVDGRRKRVPRKAWPELDSMDLLEWARTPGMAWITRIKQNLSAEQTLKSKAFVDACFMEGAKGGQKVNPDDCIKRMENDKDADGISRWGADAECGPVWDRIKVANRYSVLANGQNAASKLTDDKSAIAFMNSVRCGCGKQKQDILQMLGIKTLGDLLKVAEEDSALANLQETAKAFDMDPKALEKVQAVICKIPDWAQALKNARNDRSRAS